MCDIPDRFHGALFVFGGLTAFAKLVTFHRKMWSEFVGKALKWDKKVPMDQFQIKKLSVIALWSAVHIVLGPLLDLSSLNQEEVGDLAINKICG